MSQANIVDSKEQRLTNIFDSMRFDAIERECDDLFRADKFSFVIIKCCDGEVRFPNYFKPFFIADKESPFFSNDINIIHDVTRFGLLKKRHLEIFEKIMTDIFVLGNPDAKYIYSLEIDFADLTITASYFGMIMIRDIVVSAGIVSV
jgi:hypothetical protein